MKAREEERKNTKPNKTLFVVNFDPINTRTRDLERHFESYGKLERVQIRKNFAFVQFETVDEAIAAVKGTNGRSAPGPRIPLSATPALFHARGSLSSSPLPSPPLSSPLLSSLAHCLLWRIPVV